MDTSEIRSRKLKHARFVEKERLTYYKRKEFATLDLSGYCSIMVDGADQFHFGLSPFVANKQDNRGHLLKVPLVGFLDNGK